MYALQCTQCNPRNDVPQVRVQEPAPEKQGAKSVIKFFSLDIVLFVIPAKN
jgi:hypothetical protein